LRHYFYVGVYQIFFGSSDYYYLKLGGFMIYWKDFWVRSKKIYGLS
jgi:hypothetical protein